jgi:hypothetical protein
MTGDQIDIAQQLAETIQAENEDTACIDIEPDPQDDQPQEDTP